MRRRCVTLGALLCALVPALAVPQQGAASSNAPQVTGTVSAVGGSWVSIQTSGGRTGVVNALVATANGLARHDYHYVWGGGHAQAGVPDAGSDATARRHHWVGFDCSGSVAAVLAGAGLWPPRSGVPADNGVIAQLLQERLIARGAGSGPGEVTLYDNPGVHIFMNINGRFFGTSDGAGAGTRNGGPGWLDDGAPDSVSRSYRRYHVLPSVLRARRGSGQVLTLDSASPLPVQVGDKVTVRYRQTSAGTMVVRSVTFIGATTLTGTITSVGAATLVIQGADGLPRTFSTAALSGGLPADARPGAQVTVTYTPRRGTLVARELLVTADAPPTAGSPASG